jgi:tetratricopeptide (TPR) repeat protein
MRLQIHVRIVLLTLGAAIFPAFAQSTDGEFSALIKARKAAELESLARERLAKNPKDDIALWYLGRQFAGDAKKRDELIPRAEQCIKDLPQSSRCHNVLGSLYGAAAMSAGVTAGLKYAGSIKDMFLKAVELEPNNFDLRRDLNQFYLQAPGLAGGSVRKAIENSAAFAKFDALRAQLLRADVHIYEKEYSKAEALLNTLNAGESGFRELLQSAYISLGFAMATNGEAPSAQKLFERVIANNAGNANAHFGLGRALLEQKNFDAAIQSLERARELDPALNVHYRLGMAYQAKGDRTKAMAMFQQFLSYQSQGRAADDARKRLEDLKRT